MNLLNTSKMNYAELAKEIDKAKKKMADLQETIRILEKLQIAEQVKRSNQNRPKDSQQWR